MEGKVTIVSTFVGSVVVDLRDMHFSHTWAKKGDKFSVSKDIFEAMMYNNGARAMFEDGTLYTEDMETKIEYGLEPEGATEPVNIIILSDKEMERYLRILPLYDFKAKLENVSNEQIIGLAQYAIQNRIMDLDKFKYIKERVGIDCLAAIKMEQEAKEV